MAGGTALLDGHHGMRFPCAIIACIGRQSDRNLPCGWVVVPGFSLTSVAFPNGVISLGDRTFLACTSLTKLTIDYSVTNIGSQAFRFCISLTKVYFQGDTPALVGMYSTMTTMRPSITCWGPVAGARLLAVVRPRCGRKCRLS